MLVSVRLLVPELSVRHCLEHVRYNINLVDMNVLLDNCMVLQ